MQKLGKYYRVRSHILPTGQSRAFRSSVLGVSAAGGSADSVAMVRVRPVLDGLAVAVASGFRLRDYEASHG